MSNTQLIIIHLSGGGFLISGNEFLATPPCGLNKRLRTVEVELSFYLREYKQCVYKEVNTLEKALKLRIFTDRSYNVFREGNTDEVSQL